MAHLALAADARYLPWCGVAIRSCLDHGGDDLTIHLVHDGALSSLPEAEQLRAMVENAGARLDLHRVGPDRLRALPANGRYGTAIWLRFFLPELLPEVDRVLYLDADTLVVSGLEPLLRTDLAGAPLAAVANVTRPADRAHVQRLGLEDHRQFLNSGVLLLDLKRLRAEDSPATLFAAAAARQSDVVWPDQDILSIAFEGRWHALHPRWNAQYTLWSAPDVAREVFGPAVHDEAVNDPAVLHFEGPNLCKPWHALNTHPWRQAWWATLDRTPWRGAEPEDRGVTTAALKVLPEAPRIWMYARVLGWRKRRLAAR